MRLAELPDHHQSTLLAHAPKHMHDDPMAEETLYDSEAMRRFAGIHLGDDRIPDETTTLNFRHLLKTARADLERDRFRLNLGFPRAR